MGPTAWKLLGTAAAVAAGSVANKVVSGVWEKAAGKPAPNDPLNTDDVSWKEALLFAALSGLVIQLTRVAAQRKAAQMYQKRAGHLPKAIREHV